MDFGWEHQPLEFPDWYQYEKGVFAWCTISVMILFLVVFNVILESTIDRQSQDNLKKKIKELVQKIDKSLLTGIMKVWVYQILITCNDWMATNDLRSTSILGGISGGIP